MKRKLLQAIGQLVMAILRKAEFFEATPIEAGWWWI
ncbi:MAG: hypothetical protein ACI9HY_003226 [Planctomycetaceae bacterium]|jgi:hypothetical protein